MVGRPLFHRDTDGSDFSRAEPDAGLALAACRDEAKLADGNDEHFLEEAQVGVQVLACGEMHDRVADDLPGAVVGNVAAAISRADLDAAACQLGGVPNQIRLRAPAHAEGVDGIVLGEDEGVADFAGIAARDEFLLAPARDGIARAPPVEGRPFGRLRAGGGEGGGGAGGGGEGGGGAGVHAVRTIARGVA